MAANNWRAFPHGGLSDGAKDGDKIKDVRASRHKRVRTAVFRTHQGDPRMRVRDGWRGVDHMNCRAWANLSTPPRPSMRLEDGSVQTLFQRVRHPL